MYFVFYLTKDVPLMKETTRGKYVLPQNLKTFGGTNKKEGKLRPPKLKSVFVYILKERFSKNVTNFSLNTVSVFILRQNVTVTHPLVVNSVVRVLNVLLVIEGVNKTMTGYYFI